MPYINPEPLGRNPTPLLFGYLGTLRGSYMGARRPSFGGTLDAEGNKSPTTWGPLILGNSNAGTAKAVICLITQRLRS